jgi:tRNA A-37 threonylcarbamoyl transferase component Bud32
MVQLTDSIARNFIKQQKWKVTKLRLLGKGVNGAVYNVGSRAMKVMKGVSGKEYLAMKRLRGVKFIPKVVLGSYVANKKRKVSAFLMSKLPDTAITLKEFHRQYGTKADPNEPIILGHVITQMHIRGISHGDLHSGNIMVTHTGPKIDRLWIIDFGRSIRIPKGHSEASVYKVLKKISGYNRAYGTLYGKSSEPSRPNTKLQPHAILKKVKSRRKIVKKVLSLNPKNANIYYKSAAFTA